MNKHSELGRRIKAIRLDRQMTQTQMANYLGVSIGTIVSLEHGKKCKDLTRAKIEKLLNGQEAAA